MDKKESAFFTALGYVMAVLGIILFPLAPRLGAKGIQKLMSAPDAFHDRPPKNL